MGLTYDDLCKLVNDAYRGNPDIRIRTLANDLDIPFDIVWEMDRAITKAVQSAR